MEKVLVAGVIVVAALASMAAGVIVVSDAEMMEYYVLNDTTRLNKNAPNFFFNF